MRWRNAVGAGALAVLAALAGWGLAGCTTVRIDFQELPSEAAFQGIEPGVTTRGEVLRRLGPPEEMRRLSPFERARSGSPQARRILEAGDLFGRSVYTYASETRRSESAGVMPAGPAIFRISWRRSHERRWSIEFDGDVVSSVSHVDESRAAD